MTDCHKPHESVLIDSLSSQEDLHPGLSDLEYGQCTLKGFLHRKKHFTWTKLFCVIRNKFLECHKYRASGDSYSLVLKLYLLGSDVFKGSGNAKRKWAFQVYILLKQSH